jgi:hypothetical protein
LLKQPPEGSSELLFDEVFLRLYWDRYGPASFSFTFLNKKNFIGARSGEQVGCGSS